MFDGSAVTYGPELPDPRTGHCIGPFQDDAFFITGGYKEFSQPTSTVWYFEGKDNFSVKRMSTMKKTRVAHGCSIFSSDQHGGRPVLVAAGAETGQGQNNCEFLDFTQPSSEWQLCSKSNVHFLCTLGNVGFHNQNFGYDFFVSFRKSYKK